MKLHKIGIVAAATLIATISSSPARADDDNWEVRLRGVYLDPANNSDCDSQALSVPQMRFTSTANGCRTWISSISSRRTGRRN